MKCWTLANREESNAGVEPKMRWAAVVFATCFAKLEKLALKIVTLNETRNFWCDSHPTLCKYCHAIRFYAKTGELPPVLLIATDHGVYKCTF